MKKGWGRGLVIGLGVAGLCCSALFLIWRDDLPRPIDVFRIVKAEAGYRLGFQRNWVRLPKPNLGPAQRVQCPDPSATVVIVTGGQSNAANSNPVLSSSVADLPVYAWYDGYCYPARDPMPGASGDEGSLWPGLGAGISRELGRPVLFISGAINSSQARDWLDDRSGYLSTLVMRVEGARGAGYEPDLVIWHQGETDAYLERNMARFRRDLGQLTDRLLSAMPESRLYLFRASKCDRPRGSAELRAAQTAVAAANPRIVAGMNTDKLGYNYRWDGCHFNDDGRAAILAELVPAVAALIAATAPPAGGATGAD